MPLTEKERKILQTAIEVFLEKGWHGTRMQEIADRAGINKAMLHYYFRSKERLYITIFQELFASYLNSLSESIVAGQDFATTLRTFIDRFMDGLRQNPQLPLFVLRELNGSDELPRRALNELLSSNDLKTPQILLEEVQKAQDRGEIKLNTHPVQFLITLIGACVYYFLSIPLAQALFPGANVQSDQFFEERKKAVFEHLFNGIKNKEKNE